MTAYEKVQQIIGRASSNKGIIIAMVRWKEVFLNSKLKTFEMLRNPDRLS